MKIADYLKVRINGKYPVGGWFRFKWMGGDHNLLSTHPKEGGYFLTVDNMSAIKYRLTNHLNVGSCYLAFLKINSENSCTMSTTETIWKIQ